MHAISKEELLEKKEDFLEKIRSGHVFIYPTDTIYGIGCDASSEMAVRKVREAKDRSFAPFSVIVPSLQWVHENCEVPKHAEAWLSKLPGPYTLIFKLKKQNGLAKEVNPNLASIGVRLPNHWIAGMVRELNKPIITTSVNKSGNEFMTSLEDLDPEIHAKTDFIVYEGPKNGDPSILVDLTQGAPKVTER